MDIWHQGWFAGSAVWYISNLIKAAGYAIGVVGDVGIRANAQQ